MIRSFFLFGVSGVLFACSDQEIKSLDSVQDVSSNGTPCIAVNPSVVNFPALSATENLTAQEIVTVTNCGDDDLQILDLYLEDETGPFSLNAISSPLLLPGARAQFAVTFAPQTADESEGWVNIESNAPDTPIAEVQLNGTGIAPIIDISPSEYDFGSLYVGCDSSQPLTISNIGTADLVVSSFDFNTGSNDLSFDALEAVNGSLPWTIPPEESLDVFVDYAPLDELSDTAFLTVLSNDPYLPEAPAFQTGIAELFGENSDIFEQPIQGSTDIIFAVDRSCSMDDNVTLMLQNFEDFTSILTNMNTDYHVAATVGDSGCINPGGELYIDNTHSASQSRSIINQMIDINAQNIPYGSNEERAFTQLEAALSQAVTMNGQPLTTGCNAGLIRENAKLALVGVSDEEEQSANNYTYYVSMFQNLKSNPSDVVIHAIGGDYPNGCAGADAYNGMYQASVATGGTFLSICATDWSTHLQVLAQNSTQDLSSFALSETPVPETIVVQVNNMQTIIGWVYNPMDNAIHFEPDHIPEGGDTIQVDYALYGDCNQ